MGRTTTISKYNKTNFEINKEAVFCGSFNPFHEGHFFLLKSALNDFKHVYILVCQNENKPKQNLEQIAENIKKFLANKNLDVNKFSIMINNGLTPDFINKNFNTKIIVRGYRNLRDKIYEKRLLSNYKKLDKDIIFKLYKSPKNLKHISSKKIRTIY